MLDQILILFGEPPGSVIYHFIILFTTEAAFAISLGQWLRDRNSGTARLTLATLIIGLARLGILVAAVLAWQGVASRDVLIPTVERAVDTITVISLAWLFVTMKKDSLLRSDLIPDASAGVALGLVLVGFIGSYYYWFFSVDVAQGFNNQILDIAWSSAQVLIAIVGLVAVMVRLRTIYDPFLKGLILIVLGGASALHIINPIFGDVAAAVRLGQLIAMPMVAAMAYRHVIDQLLRWDTFTPSPAVSQTVVATPLPAIPDDDEDTTHPPTPVTPVDPPTPPQEALQATVRAPVSQPDLKMVNLSQADLELLEVVEAVGGLLNTLEEREVIREAPRAVATALKADIALLAVLDDNGKQVGIVGGYDNIAQTFLPQAVLDLEHQPSMVNTVGRVRQVRLTPQRHQSELRRLYEPLGIMHEGPTYMQPLVDGQESLGLIIVGSPYSERLFSDEERNLLVRLAPLVVKALLNAERHQDLRVELDHITQSEGIRVAELSDDLTATKATLNAAQQQIEEMKVYIRDMHRQMRSELTEQENAEQQIDHLLNEVERLREQAQEANALRSQYQTLKGNHEQAVEELNQLRENVGQTAQLEADLESLRQQAQQRGMELARLEQERDRLAEDAELVGDLQRQIGALTERYESLRARFDQGQTSGALSAAPSPEIEDLRREIRELRQQRDRLQGNGTEAGDLALQLQEVQAASQMEIASLRTRLAQSAITQQEVVMLQEQLAVKARELVKLRSQLAEMQATAAVYREQLQDERGVDFEALDRRTQEQAQEIQQLRAELAEARTTGDVQQAQVEVTELDRETIEALEEQLKERNDLVMRLESELAEATQGLTDINEIMSEVDDSITVLENTLTAKQTEIEQLQTKLQQARETARTQIAGLQQQLESGQADSSQLHQAEINALEAEVDDITARYQAVDDELDEAQAMIARLSSELAEARQAASKSTTSEARAEVIASLTQEIRTPMSSIMGYTELLLKESVGILGMSQRKFLQRVKGSTERMNGLLDDLIRITTFDTDVTLSVATVDVLYAVEEAITKVANQYRERGLTLRMALVKRSPMLNADHEAVVDIFGYLLANAALATPAGGEVHLAVEERPAELNTPMGIQEVDCVYIRVEDSGEGIDEKDIERVFSRKYRADNPLIEGLGDTGVSLSLAKGLVTAHSGAIWIESTKGVGTTFHVILPIEPLDIAE